MKLKSLGFFSCRASVGRERGGSAMGSKVYTYLAPEMAKMTYREGLE